MAVEENKIIHNFPGNARSDVWHYFGFYAIDEFAAPLQLDRSRAICKICRLAVKNHGNTTNLYNHVSKRHAVKLGLDQFHILQERKPLENGVDKETDKSRTLTCAIFKYMVTDLVSTKTIASNAFRNLVQKLNPWYDVPDETYFQNIHMPSIYRETKHRVVEQIKRNSSGIAILLDIWNSATSGTTWIGITADYVTDTWTLKSHQLQCVEKDDWNNIYDLVDNCIKEWNISQPVCIVGHDICYPEDSCSLPESVNKLNVIPCLAQTINSAALKAFEIPDISDLVVKAKKLMRYVEQHLMDIPRLQPLEDLDVLKDKSLWTSMYDMFGWLAINRSAIEDSLSRSRTKSQFINLLFTTEEQIITENLLLAFKELRTATTILCKESQPLVSMTLPVLRKLLTSLSTSESDSSAISAMKQTVHDQLTATYTQDNIHLFLVSSSLLDPRYKELPFVSKTQREEAKENIVQIALQANSVAEPIDDDTLNLIIKKESITDDESDTPPNKKTRIEIEASTSALDDWFSDVISNPSTRDHSDMDRVSAEFNKFQFTDRVSANTDPLLWWKKHEVLFPKLSKVAKRFLCIPATAVPAKQVLDPTGKSEIAARSLLPANEVDQLIFLNKNYDFNSY